MYKLSRLLPSNPRSKGYIFALLATLGMANVYVFSKAALQELDLLRFGFWWFGLALL